MMGLIKLLMVIFFLNLICVIMLLLLLCVGSVLTVSFRLLLNAFRDLFVFLICVLCVMMMV